MKKIDDRALEQKVMRVVDGVERYTPAVSWVMMLGALALSIFVPQVAFAQGGGAGLGNLCSNAQNAIGWIQTGVYFILVVAVLGSGVAAAFGRMEWATVGRILIGCIVAGLAAALVGVLYGNSNC